MQIETKELAVLKGQVSKLETQANAVTITTSEENEVATNLKAKLKEIGNTIKARKEEITKPLNVALKSARELFAPLEAQFESAENIVGRKLLVYKQKVEADVRAEEGLSLRCGPAFPATGLGGGQDGGGLLAGQRRPMRDRAQAQGHRADRGRGVSCEAIRCGGAEREAAMRSA